MSYEHSEPLSKQVWSVYKYVLKWLHWVEAVAWTFSKQPTGDTTGANRCLQRPESLFTVLQSTLVRQLPIHLSINGYPTTKWIWNKLRYSTPSPSYPCSAIIVPIVASFCSNTWLHIDVDINSIHVLYLEF